MTKRILIADDDVDIAHSLGELLREAGYETASATSAKAAFSMLGERHYDLLLTDINMPEMNGFALKKVIKQSETLNNVPVIFMSGYSPEIERAPSLVLTKPFNHNDLLSVIELTLMPETAH
ncbi:response regulator [uncultured Oxalicibacterium sp.]|uniref:response regulator n=1 Tax=uncultured Oxalicibacterium sp. TaxID=1168540 RepID=UPI0025D5A9EE|nr:response regulator [uncultured Oxalicibacterium sp.]